MKTSPQRRMPRRIALAVVLVALCTLLVATAATAAASSETPSPIESQESRTYAEPTLSADAPMALASERTSSLAVTVAAAARIETPTYRRPAPKARVRRSTGTKPKTNVERPVRSSARAAAKTAVTRVAARRPVRKTTAAKTASSGELSRARAILAGYVAKYPVCAGATVYFGKTPGASEGCVYLGSGTIVINPNHTSSLSYIIGHEIQHLRDYREQG